MNQPASSRCGIAAACRRPLLPACKLLAHSRWICSEGSGLIARVLGVNPCTQEVYYRLESDNRPLAKNAFFFQLRFEPLEAPAT